MEFSLLRPSSRLLAPPSNDTPAMYWDIAACPSWVRAVVSRNESISKPGLANEFNGLSVLCLRWKSLKTEDANGLPIRERGQEVRISQPHKR